MNAWTDVFATSRDKDCICGSNLLSIHLSMYAERQTDARWSTIDNRLSVTTPRSRAEPTTPTVDDKTGTS